MNRTAAVVRPYRSYRNELRRVFVIYGLTPVFILAAVAYALLVFWGYRLIETRTRDNAVAIARLLGAELSAYETALNRLAESEDMVAALLAVPDADADTASRVRVYEQLYAVPAGRAVKSTFHVFGPHGQPLMSDTHSFPSYAASSPGDMDMGWGIFRRMAENPGRVVWAIVESHTPLRGASVLTMGRAVRFSTQPGASEVLGFVFYDLLYDDVVALLHRPEGGEVVVTDAFRNILVTTSRDFADQFGKLAPVFRAPETYVRHGEETYFLCEAPTEFGPFVVHGIAASRYFRDIAFNGALFLTVVFGLSIWLMLVWSRRIAVRKARAVELLVDTISGASKTEHTAGAGPVGQEPSDSGDNGEISGEFRIILDAYNSMLADLHALNARHQEELRRGMRAEVKQLESQFNPHLLYNTLETVRCMIRLDPAAANTIIIKLSTLLRYSIDNRTSQVRLDDDLTHIRNYLDILKYRFGSRFDYVLETDHNADACLVPKLILQPLMENAVEHGFGERETLRVVLRADIETGNSGELLVITISDDGQGMCPETLQRLRAMLNEPENTTNIIGLYNAHRRIVLIHGANRGFGLHMDSKPGHGAAVRLVLPAVRSESGIGSC